MKLSEFKNLLQTHRDKPFHLILPSRETVPVSFHITEVAHVQKRFIDCGGKRHTTDTCQLQAWVWEDTDHRLLAGKMADVLDLARTVLPDGQDLDIEIEYEDTTISQYRVESCTVTDEAVVLNLASKHTDCLAKETCLPRAPLALGMAAEPGCCGTASASGCC